MHNIIFRTACIQILKVFLHIYYIGSINIASAEESRCMCTCSDVLAAALSSTILIFLVISIITFLTGCLCGHFFSIKFRSSKGSTINQVPEYEDIDAHPVRSTRDVKRQEQAFELNKNVAYITHQN